MSDFDHKLGSLEACKLFNFNSLFFLDAGMRTSSFARRDIVIIITDDYHFGFLCTVKKFLNELVKIMFVSF